MEKIIVKPSIGRPLKFTGKLLAETESSFNGCHPRYSGETGIRHVYKIYKTSGNNYVCIDETKTQWVGDRNSTRAIICKNPEEVFGFFQDDAGGINCFVRELIDIAGVDDSIEVD